MQLSGMQTHKLVSQAICLSISPKIFINFHTVSVKPNSIIRWYIQRIIDTYGVLYGCYINPQIFWP